MAIFQSSQILSSDGTVYSFSPTTATIDGFSFAIPESFDIYHYDVLKVDENTNLLVGSASSIDGDGSGIFYTTFDSDGFSSEPIIVLNESRNSNQSYPQIAKNDTEIFVTWSDHSHSYLSQTTGHFFDLSLNSVGDQITFSGSNFLPVSAGDLSFSVFRVYGGGRTFSQNEISSDGLIRDEIVIDYVSDARVGAITTTDGKTWLTKSLHDGYSSNVYLEQFTDGDTNEAIRANFTSTSSQSAGSIFELSNGNLLVTWSTGLKISGRFFSSEGTPLSLDLTLLDYVIHTSGYSISTREDGGFSVYYHLSDTLNVKSFDSTGAVVQDSTLLAENVTRYYNTKVITLSDTQDEVFYNIDYQLYSQKINYNAIPDGDLTISGEAIEDTVLMLSNSLIDSDGLGAFSYQWLRNDEIINNATETSYQIGQADAGSLLKVQVQYVDGNGVTETVISDPTTAVQNVNDSPIGDLSISGQLLEGIELKAVSNISDEDGIGEFSYLWYRDNLLVSNANGSEFLLAQEDVGKSIKVEAIYTDGFGTPEKVTSSATDIVLNSNDSPQGTVSILGTITEGNTLTVEADITDADGLGSFTYQWMRDDSVILGQTAEAYTLTQTDVGTQISVAVNYVDGFNYSETVNSPATNPIANLNTAAEGTVLISGIIAEKSTLTAIPSISDADGLGDFQYQWLRNGLEISGAGQNNYTLMQADVGATMSVNVTFEDAYGFSEAISSASSAVVTNVNDAPRFISETPTDFTVGQTFYYQALANDPDASDSLAFFATGKPEWLTLNSETGELFGLPTSSQLSTSIVTLRVTDELGGESEQSFSLDKTLSSSEFKVIHLDDPQSRVEYLGTSADDVAQGYSNTSYFGFEGNDVFNSGSGEEGQGFIGLEGNDTYNINAQGVIIVSDKALSDGDKISATGIAFSSPNTLAFTVENRHLLIGDANSGQEIWIIDWETPENRIETFALSGVQYSYADFNSTVKSFTNFLGDYQWSDIAELTGDTSWNNGPEFDSQIEFYTNFIENSGPEILSQPSLAVAENQHFEYQMVITDPDQNAITTGQAYLMPDWLDFDATSLQLRGTPSNSDVGTHNIILSAHDEFNSLTSQSFVLTVSDSTPPIIESVVANWGSVLNGTEDNSDGTINIVTSNIETGQVVKVGLNGRIYTASIDTAIPADHANPTVSITISAADLQSLSDGGSYSLTADVNDAAGNAAAQHISTSFVVDVTAPTLSTISTDTFSGLSGFTEIGATISVVMTDPSGTDSSLSTTSNATTGAWNITSADILGSEITSDDDGTYAFSITATDTAGNTSNASTASLEVDLPAPIIGGLNINQLSKEGDVVTYGLIADASYDLGGDGIEALDFAINFDPTDLGYIEGSLSSGFDWMLEVPNNTEASSGSVRGGFASNPLAAPFIDFSDPIAEFQMTVLESSEPVNISITGTLFDGDAAPDTIETFSYMSSTLIATVIDRDGTAMDGVTVSTSDNSQTTDDSGQLSFEVSNGSDVVMDASLAFENTSATSAINSMDALQALRIAVGLDTSNGPATYENFIAADFDGSGSVNSMDALNILKYAVGLDAPDPHWVFIDSAADHSAIKQTSVNYDTGMTLEGFSADASVSLTGILVGDVDDSYSGLIA